MLILGNLTMTSSGKNTVTVGTQDMGTGMIVGGNFTISTPATTPATSPAGSLTFTNLQVDGATSLGLGNGADSVTIATSLFVGALTIKEGSGTSTNTVTATNLQVGHNLTITNAITTTLTDLTVNGSVLISNASGDTATTLQPRCRGIQLHRGNSQHHQRNRFRRKRQLGYEHRRQRHRQQWQG